MLRHESRANDLTTNSNAGDFGDNAGAAVRDEQVVRIAEVAEIRAAVAGITHAGDKARGDPVAADFYRADLRVAVVGRGRGEIGVVITGQDGGAFDPAANGDFADGRILGR